jgi:hypothetical protein
MSAVFKLRSVRHGFWRPNLNPMEHMPSGCNLGDDFFSMDQLPLPNYEARRRPKRYIHEFAMENKRIMNDLAAMPSNSTTNPVAVDRVVSSSSKTTETSDGIVQCHRLNAASCHC